ncbi:hypothetical protein BCGKFG_BCGKFG_03990, partial [Dysosmobacter welbionis]
TLLYTIPRESTSLKKTRLRRGKLLKSSAACRKIDKSRDFSETEGHRGEGWRGKESDPMKNKGPLYVLTCYVIWGLLPIFWKLLAQVDSLYVLASRIVWSMVLTGGILLLRRDRLAGVRAAFRDRREWGLLAAAGCVVCVNWGVYIWAVANGHMIDSSLAYYMNPILAILLGTVLFRERLTKLQWLAVAVTFAGLVITV